MVDFPASRKTLPLNHMSLDAISPSPENHTLYRPVLADDSDIQALVQSIGTHGILNPLIVSRDHFIISGHRRYVAAKLAGLREVPCCVMDILHSDPDFVPLLREPSTFLMAVLSGGLFGLTILHRRWNRMAGSVKNTVNHPCRSADHCES